MAHNGSVTHMILHILAFGFTAFLLQIRSTRHTWALVVVPGTLWLATGIELAQHLIYRHPFEWQDLFADALGIVIAILPRMLSVGGVRHPNDL